MFFEPTAPGPARPAGWVEAETLSRIMISDRKRGWAGRGFTAPRQGGAIAAAAGDEFKPRSAAGGGPAEGRRVLLTGGWRPGRAEPGLERFEPGGLEARQSMAGRGGAGERGIDNRCSGHPLPCSRERAAGWIGHLANQSLQSRPRGGRGAPSVGGSAGSAGGAGSLPAGLPSASCFRGSGGQRPSHQPPATRSAQWHDNASPAGKYRVALLPVHGGPPPSLPSPARFGRNGSKSWM